MAACSVRRLWLLRPAATLVPGGFGAAGIRAALRGFGRLLGPGMQAMPSPPASRGYAKKPMFKPKGKVMVKEALKDPELSRDPEVLVSHCVGLNYFREGNDPPLRPDSEYPAWLYALNVGPALKLEDLEPNSMEYFKRLRKNHIWRVNKLSRHKRIR